MLTTLPNILTLSRILAIPALIGAFYLSSPLSNWLAFAIFTAAGITDILDGYLARSWGQESSLGRFLDPVADKLLVAATLLMLVYVGRIGDWTILPTVVILCREILVSGLREFLAELRVSVPVSRVAKWKTAVQMLAIGFLIVGEAGWDPIPAMTIGRASMWIAALFTIYTGYDYLKAGLHHVTNMTPESPSNSAGAGTDEADSR